MMNTNTAMNQARMAAAFFSDPSDAKNAVETLRQGGFAQIGVASRDEKRERKIAGREQVREGVAVSPDSGSQLRESMGETDYSDYSGDLHGTLTRAGFDEAQAAHFEQRMAGENGVLVSVQAPADRWSEARSVLDAAGGDLGPEPDNTAASPAAVQRGEVDIRQRMRQGVERVEEKLDDAKTRIPGRDQAA